MNADEKGRVAQLFNRYHAKPGSGRALCTKERERLQ
jgi:hypothetical protein